MKDKLDRFINVLIEEVSIIVDGYVNGFKGNSDLRFTKLKEQYNRLKGKLNDKELMAYKRVVINNIVEDVLFSIMSILEGGEEFNDKYLLDIIDLESKKTFMKDIDDVGLADDFIEEVYRIL